MSNSLAAQSYLSKHGLEKTKVLVGVPRNDAFNWNCGHCGREDRYMRRLRCECGQYAPMRSLRRAVQAKYELAKNPGQAPPWRNGAGSYADAARQRPPKRKGAKLVQQPAAIPPPTGAPSAEWIAKFCPHGWQEQLRALAAEELAGQRQQAQQAKPKKPPTSQIEAERNLSKAKKLFASTDKRCDEAREQIRKEQEELERLEKQHASRQELVKQATASLSELCAQKLASSENVLVPTAACLADANYRAKFDELRALQADVVKKEAAEKEAGGVNKEAPPEMDTSEGAAFVEAAQEVLGNLSEEEQGRAKRIIDELITVQAKKARATPPVPPATSVGGLSDL